MHVLLPVSRGWYGMVGFYGYRALHLFHIPVSALELLTLFVYLPSLALVLLASSHNLCFL